MGAPKVWNWASSQEARASTFCVEVFGPRVKGFGSIATAQIHSRVLCEQEAMKLYDGVALSVAAPPFSLDAKKNNELQ